MESADEIFDFVIVGSGGGSAGSLRDWHFDSRGHGADLSGCGGKCRTVIRMGHVAAKHAMGVAAASGPAKE